MSTNFVKYALLFVVMVLLQEFVFNNIQIGTLLTPYIYILFILVLPLSFSPAQVLVWSFLLGLSVDLVSCDILGMHASASLTAGYLRRFILKAVHSKEEEDDKFIPTIYNLAWRPYLTYTLSIVLAHHTALFFLEALKLDNLPFTLLRILLSTLLSTLFIVLFQLAFFKNPKG